MLSRCYLLSTAVQETKTRFRPLGGAEVRSCNKWLHFKIRRAEGPAPLPPPTAGFFWEGGRVVRRTLKLILSFPSAPTHLEGLNGIIDNPHPPPHPPTCHVWSICVTLGEDLHHGDTRPGLPVSSTSHQQNHRPPLPLLLLQQGGGDWRPQGRGHGTGSGAAAQCGGGGVGLVGLSYSRVEPQAAVGWRPTSMTSSSTYTHKHTSTHTHTSCHHQTRPNQF